MTTEDALLAAVLANPADDLPRLVLADHYEGELGQPERAEFIRVQCELSRLLSLPTWTPKQESQAGKLRRRERELWEAHAAVADMLTAPFRNCLDAHIVEYAPAGTTPSSPQAIFRRGFISEIRCTLAEWCGRSSFAEVTSVSGFNLPPVEFRSTGIGQQIVRRHPVTKVVLTDREPLEGVSKFWMWSQGIGERPRAISLPVWSLLTDFAVGSSTITRFYPTREAAISALSAALIAWAKSQPHPARISTSPVSVDVTA